MTTTAATDAIPSQASWLFHNPERPGCATVAEAIAVIPTAAKASAAVIVGTSSLSSNRRCSTAGLRAGRRARLQRRRRLLVRKAVVEEDLQHLLRDGGGGRPSVPAVLDHDREGDLGMLGRRIADEPRVVALFLRLL